MSIRRLVVRIARFGAAGGGGGGGAVTSVFGRVGIVVAALNDYAASLIDNDSGVAGATVADALDNLEAAIPPASAVASVFGRVGAVVAVLNDYAASLVDNDSTVTGGTVADALDTLKAAAGGVFDFVDNKLVAPAELHYGADANTTIIPGTDGPAGKPCMRYYFNPNALTANRTVQFSLTAAELGFYVNVIQLRKTTAGAFRYQFLDSTGANLFAPEPVLAITAAGYYFDARYNGSEWVNDANHFVYWDY